MKIIHAFLPCLLIILSCSTRKNVIRGTLLKDEPEQLVTHAEEISGKDFVIRGGTYWSRLLPLEISAPQGWKILPQESFNPKVVLADIKGLAQAELYWVVLFESAGLKNFISEFLDRNSITPQQTKQHHHPDGEMMLVTGIKNGLGRNIFFIKKMSRIFIISCTAYSGKITEYEADFFYIADNFRLFEGYKIK